ncbi:MAG: hypothetical protein IT381_07425 [Deltaproteobacteria bacterium]|nr:hypothetical protein [Deltaproteobacteria bacterium]
MKVQTFAVSRTWALLCLAFLGSCHRPLSQVRFAHFELSMREEGFTAFMHAHECYDAKEYFFTVNGVRVNGGQGDQTYVDRYATVEPCSRAIGFGFSREQFERMLDPSEPVLRFEARDHEGSAALLVVELANPLRTYSAKLVEPAGGSVNGGETLRISYEPVDARARVVFTRPDTGQGFTPQEEFAAGEVSFAYPMVTAGGAAYVWIELDRSLEFARCEGPEHCIGHDDGPTVQIDLQVAP